MKKKKLAKNLVKAILKSGDIPGDFADIVKVTVEDGRGSLGTWLITVTQYDHKMFLYEVSSDGGWVEKSR